MKYLNDKPFSVHVGTKAYRDGWDAIFGSKEEEVPDTEPEVAIPLVTIKFRSDGTPVVERKT